MDAHTSDTVVAAVDALQVAEDTLAIAREATVEKEAALARAKEAETKLVLLQKVAAEHAQAVDGIVEFLEQQGFVAPENLEKLA
jgi:FtsZ-interacting cell division protein ZipA